MAVAEDMTSWVRADLPGHPRATIPAMRTMTGLAAAAVLVMVPGLVLVLVGARGPLAAVFSMDARGSLARMFITGVLLAAAVVALLGARRQPGRRSWWAAVAAIAGGLAVTKADGTVHVRLVAAIGSPLLAMVVLGLVAALGLVALWVLSSGDRRDRRRVLGAIGAHAAAAVGLAAASTYAFAWGGTVAGVVATFVEESSEALTAVALLAAVLLGVLPRVMLGLTVPLRRRDDKLPAGLAGLSGAARSGPRSA
jgi:hypothetical protein